MDKPTGSVPYGHPDPVLSGSADTVIVIGAGAAGLMAARELSAAGRPTILLEAADAPGGRIRTLRGGAGDPGLLFGTSFSQPVEAGAEFVHGDLPLTLQLLKEAGIPYHRVGGKMISVCKGKWEGQGLLHMEWNQLMRRMRELKKDMPLAEFLAGSFGGEEYAGLRNSAEGYAKGFDLADPHRASTMALSKEWNAGEGDQYRIEGGYCRLIDYLADQCREKGCALHFSSPVKKIGWERGKVEISTAAGAVFTGGKVIITVSAGVLQLPVNAAGSGTPGHVAASASAAAIRFSPTIADHLRAAGQLGYGTVTKVLMEFRQPFWKERKSKLGFIISDEEIPTWWTQLPDEYPLLTGWLPGPAPAMLSGSGTGKEEMTGRCLSSLAAIFGEAPAWLKERLVAVHITDWTREPFILGGYSFDTVESAGARELLRKPVQDTIYFAGEALHEGTAPATVEAALDSGLETARKIAAQS